MYKEQEIKDLINRLNHYTKLYDAGKPEISDKEWDNLYFKLAKMEKETGLYFKDSPTQKINYQIVNQLNKVEHNHPMLSLDKTKDLDTIKAFLGKKEYIVMAKMDGLTCSLLYEDGKLIKAETRGNGIIGEDILHNALQVKNIPNKIDYKDRLVIDGEIICTYSDFEAFKDEYKNPRNFASGSIRLLDSKESAMRKLSFIAWDCIEGLNEETLSAKLLKLDTLGFTIVPFEIKLSEYGTIEQIIDIVKKSSEEYPIDGLVFKYDNCKEYEAAGKTDHHFKGGMAYKFYDEEYETTLQGIEWGMGKTGVLTPVAIFEPIEIDGTVVEKASLHNVSIMYDTLGKVPYIGQKIYVYKSNMIIPQIARAEKATNITEIANKYDVPSFPTVCPICGEPTIIKKENNSAIMYCSNADCEGKTLNRLDHFCSKKGLDIKGLSKATLEKLMDWGWLNTYPDIFTLKNYKSLWIKKAGFGLASVNKILNSIEESRTTTLEKVIAAAGIPEIGSKVAKDLAKYYNSWEDFRAETSFIQCEGIGDVMNYNLIHFDYNSLQFEDMVKSFLIIENKAKNNKNSNSLEGKTFCITGKLKQFKNRNELIADIENKGGRVVGSMSSKVNYLINNDSTSSSSKNRAAQEVGIPILTEEEYLKLI